MQSNSTINCPSTKKLEDILSNSSVDLQIIEHVDCCFQCQSNLDRLSDPPYLEEYRAPVQKSIDTAHFLEQSPSPNSLGIIGDIEIHSKVGAGAMGVVFRGEDLKLGRTVAVKVLKRASSLESNLRFLRETRAAAKLNHPNLVPVYSAGQATDGRPYLVMPLVEGTSLKERLELGVPEPIEAARITRQVALGLEHAHQKGIFHRDVKPANILLDSHDGQSKLTDFGLVRSTGDETLTEIDVICGTPEYMSPNSVDESSDPELDDIYSLGIVLFECLTGTTPFRGQPLDILEQHRSSNPQPPRNLNRSIPVDLETICLKALSKEPQLRYKSASEFADDLLRFLEDRPILATRESRFAKSMRWVRRNSALATAIGLAIFLLSAGTVVSTYFWLKSEKSAELAHERLESIEEVNRTLRQNQNELSRALRNSPAGKLTSYSFAGDLPTSVRNRLMIEIAGNWRLLLERSQNNLGELREMATQILETTEIANELGMDLRVFELASLSKDIASTILSVDEKTPHDILLAAQIFEKRAVAVRKTDAELSVEHLQQSEDLIGQVEKSQASDKEVLELAKIQLANIQRIKTLWEEDKTKSRKSLLALIESLPPWESLDPEKQPDQRWLSVHSTAKKDLAKKSQPLEAIKLRKERSRIIEHRYSKMRDFDPQRILLARRNAVNDVMIGVAYSRVSKLDPAFESFEKARESLEALVAVYPQNAQYRADLFELRLIVANLSWISGQKSQSLADYESAIEFHRLTLKLNPGDPTLHRRVANVLEVVSQRYQAHGDESKSGNVLMEAVGMLEKAYVFEKIDRRDRNVENRIRLLDKAIKFFDQAGDETKVRDARLRRERTLDDPVMSDSWNHSDLYLY